MTAPILRNWRLIAGNGVKLGILVGEVSGHPLLPDGWVTTSAVAAIADDGTWAKTASRRYLLDGPLPENVPLPAAATQAVLVRLLRNVGPLPDMAALDRLVAIASSLSRAPGPRGGSGRDHHGR